MNKKVISMYQKLNGLKPGDVVMPCRSRCCLQIEKINSDLFHIIDSKGNRVECTENELKNFVSAFFNSSQDYFLPDHLG